ncbi:MAG: acyltransferase family protein [Pseudooceanicola sp.]
MDSNPALARKTRSNLLDAIRACAVVMVVLYHVAIDFPPAAGDAVALWFRTYGLFGVDIFFPLSGYLITGFLLKRNSPADIRVFFLRRVFRIMPLYYLALATYLVGCLVTGIDRDIIANLWQNALFITGWTIFHAGRETVPFTITWSLSVEEFAYILVGLSALVLRGRLASVLALFALGAIALRVWINFNGWPNAYFYPPARLDSIMLGGLLAWAHQRRYPVLVPMLVALAVGIWIAGQGRIALANTIYVNITLGTCLAIHIAQTYLPRMQDPLSSAIGSLGFYSYFIYLFHYFNIAASGIIAHRLGLDPNFWIMATGVVLVTYVQAWVSYRIFEGPMMGYGHRLEARGRVQPPAP